jgi:hypothetical protein
LIRPPQDPAWACDIFALQTAAAREDDVRRARGRGDDGERREQADEIYQTFAGLAPDRFPLITAHAAQMVAGDGGERFRFAIDVVIDGLLARAARR